MPLIFSGAVWTQRISTYRDIFRSNKIALFDQSSGALKLGPGIRRRNTPRLKNYTTKL